MSDFLGELLSGILGEAVMSRLGDSRRVQTLARMFFGLLGAGLGIAGAIHFGLRSPGANLPMHLSMIALFLALASLCLFNVSLLRSWRWPGRLFVASFVALFATRILFGAP